LRGGVELLVDEATGRYGRIDVLVNNAGVSTAVAALDFTADDFRRQIEIDLLVPYALARAAAAIAESRSASVINIGSVLGTVGGGKLRVPGYAAAKGGLHNFTRELASEWAVPANSTSSMACCFSWPDLHRVSSPGRSSMSVADGPPHKPAGPLAPEFRVAALVHTFSPK